VNAISVLIISLNNSIKASEKCDLFRRLGQQFLLLAGQIENDDEITDNEFNLLALKYENLVNDILFEEIPNRFKMQVIESFKGRHLPLQLNGCSGNNKNFIPLQPAQSQQLHSNSAEIVIRQANAMNSAV
jgi:hypothetical protein